MYYNPDKLVENQKIYMVIHYIKEDEYVLTQGILEAFQQEDYRSKYYFRINENGNIFTFHDVETDIATVKTIIKDVMEFEIYFDLFDYVVAAEKRIMSAIENNKPLKYTD